MGARRVKRVRKGNEPVSLQAFRQAQPQATWEQLRTDPNNGGMQAYADIRSESNLSQGGICAYCEIDIRDNDSLKSRVEHFHAKSHTVLIYLRKSIVRSCIQPLTAQPACH